METDSWEDSDTEFRTSSPGFTSEDEVYPPLLASSPSKFAPINSFNYGGKLRASLPGKVYGHRKQRRFENDFFFQSSPRFMLENGHLPSWAMSNPTMMALCAHLEALHLEEQQSIPDGVFRALKKQADPQVFEAFIEGEDFIALSAKLNRLVAHRRSPPRYQLMLEDSKKTESKTERLAKVDRKIRQHLVRAAEFIRSLEQAIEHGEDETNELAGCIMREPISETDDVALLITLESGFHRMLCHGFAQFHNVSSRSSSCGNNRIVRLVVSKTFKPGNTLSCYLSELRDNRVRV